MYQQRLQKGLQLIQALLTCPEGEEWILLKQHEDVVDAEFIQLMEQVAAQLQREGDRQAANYLHNWAAQLHHILVKEIETPDVINDHSQAYLQLIQQLIDCPEGKEQEILSRHQKLIGPALVAMMHQVAQQMAQQGVIDKAQYLDNLAQQLNQSWILTHVTPSSPKAHQQQTQLTETASQSSARSPTKSLDNEEIPDFWNSNAPFSSSLHLKVPQQIANGLHDVTMVLHEIEKALHAQAKDLQGLVQSMKSSTEAQADTATELDHPLWYMEALEQACEKKWVLSTAEIHKLIGVKPKCRKGESVYHRGCWQFQKSGKLGNQTAWRVYHKLSE